MNLKQFIVYLVLISFCLAQKPTMKQLPQLYIADSDTGWIYIPDVFDQMRSGDTVATDDSRAHFTSITEAATGEFDVGASLGLINPTPSLTGIDFFGVDLNLGNLIGFSASDLKQVIRYNFDKTSPVDSFVVSSTQAPKGIVSILGLKDGGKTIHYGVFSETQHSEKDIDVSTYLPNFTNKVGSELLKSGKVLVYDQAIDGAASSPFIMLLSGKPEAPAINGVKLTKDTFGVEFTSIIRIKVIDPFVYFTIVTATGNVLFSCSYSEDPTFAFSDCQAVQGLPDGLISSSLASNTVLFGQTKSNNLIQCDYVEGTKKVSSCLNSKRSLFSGQSYLLGDIYPEYITLVDSTTKSPKKLIFMTQKLKNDLGFKAIEDRYATAMFVKAENFIVIKNTIWTRSSQKAENSRIEVFGGDIPARTASFRISWTKKGDTSPSGWATFGVKVYDKSISTLSVDEPFSKVQGYVGSPTLLPISSDRIAGNNLLFAPKPHPDFTFEVNYNKKMTVNLKDVDGYTLTNAEMLSTTIGVGFYKGTKDTILVPITCQKSEQSQLDCEAQAKFVTLSSDAVILNVYQSKIPSIKGGYAFVQDSTSITVVHFDQNGIQSMKITGVKNIVHAFYSITGAQPQTPMFSLTSTIDKSVYYYKISKFEDMAAPTLTINAQTAPNSPNTFCPIEVQNCPKDDMFYEITSHCPGSDTRVVEFYIGDVTASYQKSVLLNQNSYATEPTTFKKCPTGFEFVVFTGDKFYGRSILRDDSFQQFDLESFGIDFPKGIICTENSFSAVAVGHTDHNTKAFAIIRGNQINDVRNKIHSVVEVDQSAWISAHESLDMARSFVTVSVVTKGKLDIYVAHLNGPEIYFTQKTKEGSSTPLVVTVTSTANKKPFSYDIKFVNREITFFSKETSLISMNKTSDNIEKGDYKFTSDRTQGPIKTITKQCSEPVICENIQIYGRSTKFMEIKTTYGEILGLPYGGSIGVSWSTADGITVKTKLTEMKSGGKSVEFEGNCKHFKSRLAGGKMIVSAECLKGGSSLLIMIYEEGKDMIPTIFGADDYEGVSFDVISDGTNLYCGYTIPIEKQAIIQTFTINGTTIKPTTSFTMDNVDRINLVAVGNKIIALGYDSKTKKENLKGLVITASANANTNFDLALPWGLALDQVVCNEGECVFSFLGTSLVRTSFAEDGDKIKLSFSESYNLYPMSELPESIFIKADYIVIQARDKSVLLFKKGYPDLYYQVSSGKTPSGKTIESIYVTKLKADSKEIKIGQLSLSSYEESNTQGMGIELDREFGFEELTKISISFGDNDIKVTDVFFKSGYTPPKKTGSKALWFVLIGVVVIFIGIAIWKSCESGGEEGNYKSIEQTDNRNKIDDDEEGAIGYGKNQEDEELN